jgi:hypothetical protein
MTWDFADSLEEFERNFFKLVPLEVTNEEKYDTRGRVIPQEPQKVEIIGVVLPLTNDDLKFDEGGNYTTHDRKVYVYEPLPIGMEIEVDSNIYKIVQKRDYGGLTDVCFYFVKRVGGSSD